MSDTKTKPLYYIGSGHLICGDGNQRRKIYKGERIPDGCMDADEIDSLRAKGLIASPDDLELDRIPEIKRGTQMQTSADDKTTAPPDDPNAALPGGWGFNPRVLEGRDLPSLNNLIADHAARIRRVPPKPFGSVADALAFLTSEYKAPK